MLKLSLQIFYRRYHELVDRYEISIPQMAIDLFPLPTRHIPDLTIRVTCLKRNRNYLSFTSTRVHILHEHSSSHPSRALEFTSFTSTRVHILHEHSSPHPSRALEFTSFTSTRVHILHEHSSSLHGFLLLFFFVCLFTCCFSFGRFVLFIFLVFLYYDVCYAFLRYVFPVALDCPLLIDPSVLSNVNFIAGF
jgi:hypothetical protein